MSATVRYDHRSPVMLHKRLVSLGGSDRHQWIEYTGPFSGNHKATVPATPSEKLAEKTTTKPN